MATARMAFWALVFTVSVLDQGFSVFAATLELTASTSSPVTEGTGLTLTCTVNGNISSGEWVYFDYASSLSFSSVYEACYVWTKGDACYSYYPWDQCYCSSMSSSTFRTYKMIIREVKVTHARTWRCRLWSAGDKSNYLNFVVNGRPTRPALSPLSTAVSLGRDVTLTCSSQRTSMPESSRTSLVYTWTKNGATISGETSSSLVLRSVTKSVEGIYTCVATESGKSLPSEPSNEVNVDVQYAPSSVTLSPSTSSYEVRETAGAVPSIQCQADCDPGCLFRWTDKGGNPVGGTGSALQLTSLSRQQSGAFTCSASNHLGLSTAQVFITATYPPEVTLTLTAVRLVEGDNVTVQCKVDASPPAVLSWTKQSAPGDVTFLPQPSPWLELRGVGEGDTGLYTCSASNRLSSQGYTSQASVNILVTRQQRVQSDQDSPKEDAILSWKAALGIGIAVGCVFIGLLAGLLCVLLIRRKRESKDVQGEESTDNSYENLDPRTRRNARDNATYQQFQLHENHEVVRIEDIIRGNQAADQQGNQAADQQGIQSQRVKVAGRQSQNPDAGRRVSEAAPMKGRESRAEGESRKSKANGKDEAKVQETKECQSGAAQTDDRKSKAEEKDSRKSKVEERENRKSKAEERENTKSKAEGKESRYSKAEGKDEVKVQENNGRQSKVAERESRQSTTGKKEEGKTGGKIQGKQGEEKKGDVKGPPMMAEPLYINSTVM